MNWLDCFQLSEVNNLEYLRGGSSLEFLMNRNLFNKLERINKFVSKFEKENFKEFYFCFSLSNLEAGVNKLINLMDLPLRLLKKATKSAD